VRLEIESEDIDGCQLAPPLAQLAALNCEFEKDAAATPPPRRRKSRTPDHAFVPATHGGGARGSDERARGHRRRYSDFGGWLVYALSYRYERMFG
jgi:hypothetical protein